MSSLSSNSTQLLTITGSEPLLCFGVLLYSSGQKCYNSTTLEDFRYQTTFLRSHHSTLSKLWLHNEIVPFRSGLASGHYFLLWLFVYLNRHFQYRYFIKQKKKIRKCRLSAAYLSTFKHMKEHMITLAPRKLKVLIY